MQSTGLLNRVAILLFNLFAAAKGYRFIQVKTPQQQRDFETVHRESGFSFPEEIRQTVSLYKKGGALFVAYHKDRPAGTVRLGDPKVANRPFDVFGVDEAGDHFEIQSLVVTKEFREGSQFVMLGLFKAMYCYSVRRNIRSWISLSVRSVYLTMRRYSKEIQLIELDYKNVPHPLGRYLCANNIVDTCYTKPVASFSPWEIFKKFIKMKARAFNPHASVSLRIPGFRVSTSV